MIKVVAGMRRSGKSYLLFRLFVDHLKSLGVDETHIVTIELDRQENAKYRSAAALYGYIRSGITSSRRLWCRIGKRWSRSNARFRTFPTLFGA